jgi:hypothetical protein
MLQVGGLKAGSAPKKAAAGKQPGGAGSSSSKHAKGGAPGKEEPDDSVRCRMANICEGAMACQPDGVLTHHFSKSAHVLALRAYNAPACYHTPPVQPARFACKLGTAFAIVASTLQSMS